MLWLSWISALASSLLTSLQLLWAGHLLVVTQEMEGEPLGAEKTGHELGEESALEEDSIVDFMTEEPDAEAEPVVPVVSRMNARGVRAASFDSGGELQQEEPAQDDLFWLRGVGEALNMTHLTDLKVR